MQSVIDSCPGVLTLHPGRDGQVARIRLPGGYVAARQWTDLTALAGEFGDGNLDLTARGNVQVRGIQPDAAPALAAAAEQAGLLPSGEHDRSRNITASPLAGLGGRPQLRALVAALDEEIVARPDLAALPGRFLFAVDDGRGGGGLPRCDVGLRLAGRRAELFIAGASAGLTVPVADGVAAMIDAAEAAVELGVGQDAARIAGLPGGRAAVTAAVGGTPGPAAKPDPGRMLPGPVGAGAIVTAARLGRLTAAEATLIGSLLRTTEVIRLAPAGRIVIPLAVTPAAVAARLAGTTLVTSHADPMAGVTACAGLACSQSVADVRALAKPLPGHPRTHWAGCERGCGAPADASLIIATGPESFETGGRPVRVLMAGAS